ncbi:MAG: tyrosine-type recombinase/integrase, partial [Desulfovibrio sp.]|nr:tyrosine-type recombinase/integrase [Desulfovibrio sp.]
CLEWSDIDFRTRQIRLRAETAKNERTAFVPMNEYAERILREVVPTESKLVFSEKNFQSTRVHKLIAYARQFLPSGFRAFHGLRHVFASTLASSGVADMMRLQKLLTQQSPEMVQRYSHLHDEALRQASGVIGTLFENAVNDATHHNGEQTQKAAEQRARVQAFDAFKKR